LSPDADESQLNCLKDKRIARRIAPFIACHRCACPVFLYFFYFYNPVKGGPWEYAQFARLDL